MALGRGSPAPRSARRFTAGVGFDEQRGVFLRTEADATARLGALYAQLRRELQDFLGSPGLSSSDQAFYGELFRQADLRLKAVQTGAAQWVEEIVPRAFVYGVALQGVDVILQPIHDQALRFLSGYTLDLISETGEAVRRTIQQEVGQAVAGSISRQQLVDRLLSSGLTEGPWKDVETRAMVIGRTETMRAYNAGNIAGIRSNGAVLGVWIATRDERVCPICGDRDGRTFVLPGVTEAELIAAGVDPGRYVQLDDVTMRGTSSAPPAHPRCRCTLRAQYRDESGKLLTPQQPAETPQAAAGVDPAQIPTPASSLPEWSTMLKALTKPDPALRAAEKTTADALSRLDFLRGQIRELERRRQVNEQLGGLDPASEWYGGPASLGWAKATAEIEQLRAGLPALAAAYDAAIAAQAAAGSTELAAAWRAVELTAERIAEISAYTGKAGTQSLDNLLRWRYGMANGFVAPSAGWGSAVRQAVIESLETYRRVNPDLVVDSAWLKGFGDVGFGSRMGSNVLGTYTSASMMIRVAYRRLDVGGDYAYGKGLRSGTVNAPGEIVLHEIGHSILQTLRDLEGIERTGKVPIWSFRAGVNLQTEAKWISKVDAGVAYREWLDVEKATSKFVSYGSPRLGPEDVAYLRRQIDEYEARLRQGSGDYLERSRWSAHLNRMRLELQEAETIERGEDLWPTEYAKDGKDQTHEDFAESIMLFLLNPEKLQRSSPRRYAWMKKWIGKGG